MRKGFLFVAVVVLVLCGVWGRGALKAADTPVLTWSITTVAGTGQSGSGGDGSAATLASLSSPADVAVDATGNVYIADSSNNRVRRVDATTGVISTFAGAECCTYVDGAQANTVYIPRPEGLAFDPAGNLYVVSSHRILKVSAATGAVNVVAGTGSSGSSGDGGPAIAAQLNDPADVVVGPAGDLFIADYDNHRIRKVTSATGVITTVAGNGTSGFSGDDGAATSARLSSPTGVAVGPSGQLFIADSGNHRIRVVDPNSLQITTFAGTTEYITFMGEGVAATSTALYQPRRLAVDAAGNLLVTDSGHQRVRLISATDGRIRTIAGTGQSPPSGGSVSTPAGTVASATALSGPLGLAVGADGRVFIVDGNRACVLTPNGAPAHLIGIVAGTPRVSAYTGDGGPAAAARIRSPRGLAIDAAGHVYLADSASHVVRRIAAGTGIVTTIAGTGSSGATGDGGPATEARLSSPEDVAVDPAGNIYIADLGNLRIRRVNAVTGVITTVAGSGTSGADGDGGPATAAQLRRPSALALDGTGICTSPIGTITKFVAWI